MKKLTIHFSLLVALAFVPAMYLGVHVFYAVGNYYPRHIMAAYFAMGLVTMTIAAQRAVVDRRIDVTRPQ